MTFVVNLIFLVISFIILAIAGGFATNSAVRITQIPAWDQNDKLKQARHYLTIAAVVTWITIAAILVIIVLYLMFGLETTELPGVVTGITYILLFGSLGATIAVGILSAIASQRINEAKVPNDNNARRQSIIATVLAIVGFVGILIGLILKLFKKSPDKSKTAEQRAKELTRLKLLIKKLKDKESGSPSGGELTLNETDITKYESEINALVKKIIQDKLVEKNK